MQQRKRNKNGDMNVRWGEGIPERLDKMRAAMGLRSVGELARLHVIPALVAWEEQQVAKSKKGGAR